MILLKINSKEEVYLLDVLLAEHIKFARVWLKAMEPNKTPYYEKMKKDLENRITMLSNMRHAINEGVNT